MNNIPIKYHAKIRQMIKKAREEEREKTLGEVVKIMKDNSYMYIGRFEEYIKNLIKKEL